MALRWWRQTLGLIAAVCIALIAFPGLSAAADPVAALPNADTMRDQGDQSAVADQLAARFGDHSGYGLGRFEKDDRTITLYWAGKVPEELHQFVATRPRGITVDVKSAPYSLAELEAEVKRLTDGARRFGVEMNGVNIPITMSHLVLYVEPGSDTGGITALEPKVPVRFKEREGGGVRGELLMTHQPSRVVPTVIIVGGCIVFVVALFVGWRLRLARLNTMRIQHAVREEPQP